MVELDVANNRINAELLLKGMWYSNLPDLLDLNELTNHLDDIFEYINEEKSVEYKKDTDGFIVEWKNIVSPQYIRSPGVEALSFFDFKRNKSLREMQIPNLIFYISFMYNTLLEFSIFEKLYVELSNEEIVENSNSYLVFKDAFAVYDYDGEESWELTGTFSIKNTKINNATILRENKIRYMHAEADYMYSLKMDIESFFPSLYTHNFEKISEKEPFKSLDVNEKYFKFLDCYHQRINNNQTKGIPSGVFSSHVAAELCMLCVDYEIREYIKSKNNRIGYIRYVDDLTFFSDSKNELTELFPIVQQILNRYRLRINGNKTESINSVYIPQPSYITEIEHYFPYLKKSDECKIMDIVDFYEFKKYICACLVDKRTSQIKALLSFLFNRLQEDNIDIQNISMELFYYLIKLVFEDESLVCHIYRLIDLLLEQSENKEKLIKSLINKREKIDTEYSDTIFQIWHYFILFKYSDNAEKKSIIENLKGKKYNPLVITTMIEKGDKQNKEIFKYIKTCYIDEAGSKNWKSEIIFSKWWLPLFKIKQFDSYDYDKLMNSKHIPEILKKLL